MVWPILIVIGVILFIALYMYKKDHGTRGFPLNRYCLNCKKRFPDNLTSCPYCGELYFASQIK